ncbi:MAG: hypothetical protein ACR2L1_11565 [Pyrinomonadaceae bacterium]
MKIYVWYYGKAAKYFGSPATQVESKAEIVLINLFAEQCMFTEPDRKVANEDFSRIKKLPGGFTTR